MQYTAGYGSWDRAECQPRSGTRTQTKAKRTCQFRVVLDAPPLKTVTIDYATEDGTATAGSDYTATRGTLTIDPPQIRQDRPKR